ncbi:ABC transporter permease [Verminephrobacter aporrectodeae]|uniref:ABC transporter permease n=1 Tax=Verminephrobacter aporrectodeae TaxID=1110389 RepID=UPI0002375DC8|nr:ABC transporter permease [Verminephrobacter aporrectodeae]
MIAMGAVAHSQPSRSAALLVLPAYIVLTLCFFIPLIWIGVQSLTDVRAPGFTLSLSNYARFFSDSHYVAGLLWRTVWLSCTATLLALIIGYAGAYFVTRLDERAQSTMLFLVMCPLWVNLVVRTLSLMVILGRDGVVNGFLVATGIVPKPIQLLYNDWAVLFGMVQMSTPFVFLTLYGVLKQIPNELTSAALTVGATPLRAFVRVFLPLSVPGLIAAGVLALGINMESFVVPILLGGGRVTFMSVAAYEMATVSNNFPFAATIGMILLATTFFAIFLYQWAMKRVFLSSHY